MACELPQAEADRRYSARELVDLALKGHFCIRAVIDRTIREIASTHGSKGLEMMYRLPDLPAYGSEDEIDRWQETLLQLSELLAAAAPVAEADPNQMELFSA